MSFSRAFSVLVLSEGAMHNVIAFPEQKIVRKQASSPIRPRRARQSKAQTFPGRSSNQHTSEYIAESVHHLFSLAHENKMDVLAYLLQMAAKEAEELGRHR
jgi:hypothetical protein